MNASASHVLFGLVAMVFVISVLIAGVMLGVRFLFVYLGEIFSPSEDKKSEYVCTQCGEKGKPKKLLRGSAVVELFLYLFFLVPGLFYSFWRSNGPTNGCPHCKKDTMISTDSPIGRKLIESTGRTTATVP